MSIELSTKEKINRVAIEYLAPLDEKSYPFQIIGKMQKFRDTIFDENIIDECNDFDHVTHTEAVSMEMEKFHQVDDMAWLSANFFDATFFYVSGKTNGVVFVGFEKRVDAARTLFTYLANIAFAVRETYIASLKRFKKQSSKEERADEYMDDWIESILERNRYDDKGYDSTYADEFLKYTKKHFVTFDEKCKIAMQAAKIFKPLMNGSFTEKLKNGSVTFEEFKKDFHEKFSEEKTDKIFKKLDRLKEQDTIISFPYKDWIEKQMDLDRCF